MPTFILCISDDRTKRHGRIGLVDGELRVLEATVHFIDELQRILGTVLAVPVVRTETVEGRELAVDAEPARHDDPRLLDTVVAAFRACGYVAVLFEPLRADIWHMLRTLPLDLDIRDTLTPGLGAMPDADAEELLGMLYAAQDELVQIAAAADEEHVSVTLRHAEAAKRELGDVANEGSPGKNDQ